MGAVCGVRGTGNIKTPGIGMRLTGSCRNIPTRDFLVMQMTFSGKMNESQKGIPTGQAKIAGNRPLAETVLGEADMQEMEVEHSDLIKRIQNSAIAAGMPPDIAEGMSDPGREWKDMDRQMGHKRWEFKLSLSKLGTAFSKLFKRGA